MNKGPEKTRAKKGRSVSMQMVYPNAAGIDIGDGFHVVAVPGDRDENNVRRFGAFTEDLDKVALWLKQCRIESVAMESTGVYWKNLFMVLVQHGFAVHLVNAKQTRNVTGKKDDESDAEWIQKLHSCGLLKSCFLPDDHTETLRTLVRHRRSLTQDGSRYVLRMQKSMELMNIKVHTVISDITGKTGTAIIKAIITGERDPKNFLPLIDSRIKAGKEEILKSLQGNWRAEHLFLIQQCYNLYQNIQSQIQLCDQQIEKALQSMPRHKEMPTQKVAKRKKSKNQPRFNTTDYLNSIHGVDVTQIFGVSEIGGLEILSETGTDLTKWSDEKKFVSWLNLCPNNKITGGKLISSQLLKKKPTRPHKHLEWRQMLYSQVITG